MSSHHIIRDEQEPPLLVFSILHNWRHLNQLLGWSPILMVNTSLKQEFHLREIKIDGYLILDKDTQPVSKNDLIVSEVNPLASILEWIIGKNYTALHIFCEETLMFRVLEETSSATLAIPIVFFAAEGKYILKPSRIFKKWYVKGSKLKVLNSEVLTIENLKKEQDEYCVQQDGLVKFTVSDANVLLKEVI